MDPRNREGAGGPTLGALVRTARNAAGRSQESLATELGKRKQLISSAERDVHLPPFDLLVRLHHLLYTGPEDQRGASLGLWVTRWVEARAARSSLELGERAAVAEMVGLMDNALAPRPPVQRTTRPYVSLEDFPAAFQPLTIIAGDRRETSGNRLSLADLFAYSVSITDVTFLPLLPAMDPPPRIRSDKLVVVMDDDFLETEFGNSNLLIIGSPAVNWAARMINQQSLFRFDIDAEWVAWDQDLRQRPELQDEQVLRYFWTILRMTEEAREKGRRLDDKAIQRQLNPKESAEVGQLVGEALDAARDLLKEFRLRYVMNKFRRTGILDPADGLIHGEVTRENNDFALISLAPNLFDPARQHVAIIVAGIHGPGTTHALRILSTEQEAFKDYPFGGVLEFVLPRYSDWSTRFQRVTWEWQTQPYTPDALLERFAEAHTSDGYGRAESLKRYSGAEIAACSGFISGLLGRAPQAP